MFAILRTSALRLGLPFLALVSLLFVMVPSASATAPITCVGVTTPDVITVEVVGQNGPNLRMRWNVRTETSDPCSQGIWSADFNIVLFPDGAFQGHGTGTFVGTINDETGTARAGTLEYRTSVHGKTIGEGVVKVTFTILRGTGELANLRGTFTSVDLLKLHWDP